MESLKELEEEQRGFFESGAKISLIEEKERTVASRIEELSKEEQKKKLKKLEKLILKNYHILKKTKIERKILSG